MENTSAARCLRGSRRRRGRDELDRLDDFSGSFVASGIAERVTPPRYLNSRDLPSMTGNPASARCRRGRDARPVRHDCDLIHLFVRVHTLLGSARCRGRAARPRGVPDCEIVRSCGMGHPRDGSRSCLGVRMSTSPDCSFGSSPASGSLPLPWESALHAFVAHALLVATMEAPREDREESSGLAKPLDRSLRHETTDRDSLDQC